MRESLKILVSGLQINSAVFLSKMFPILSGPDAAVSLRQERILLTLSSSKLISYKGASVRKVSWGRGGASMSGTVLH